MNARVVAAALISILLANCGGGGGAGGGVVPTQPGGGTPQIVKFTFKVPAKAKQVVRMKMIGGKYVSPATLGLGISFSTTATTFTASQLTTPNVAIDLSQCVATAFSTCTKNADGSETFTASMPIPPGTYAFEVVTWDCSPSGAPLTFSGNQLSNALTSVTVTAGATVPSPNFVLNAVPASLVLTPVPGQTHLANDGAGDTIITGNSTQYFFLNALDADGFIITGSGAPTLAMSDTAGAFKYTQNAASPNTWGIKALAPALSTSSVTVSFSALGAGGGTPVSGTATLLPKPEVWLATTGVTYPAVLQGFQGNPVFGATPSFSVSGTPLDTAVPSSSAGSLAVDVDGNLWATQGANIQEYAAATYGFPPQTVATAIALPTTNTPGGIAFDNNDMLWVTDPKAGAVYVYNPNGSLGSPVATATQPTLAGAQSISVAPNTSAIPASLRGAVFVGSNPGLNSSSLDVLTLSGTTITDTVQCSIPGTTLMLAVGGDGSLWTYDGANMFEYTVTANGSGVFQCPSSANASVAAGNLTGTQMLVDPIGDLGVTWVSGATSFTRSGATITSSTAVYLFESDPGSGIALVP